MFGMLFLLGKGVAFKVPPGAWPCGLLCDPASGAPRTHTTPHKCFKQKPSFCTDGFCLNRWLKTDGSIKAPTVHRICSKHYGDAKIVLDGGLSTENNHPYKIGGLE